MATSLTPAHHRWRIKVFVATWLSYVGFYFCRKPFSAAKAAIGAEAHWDAATLGNVWAAYLIAYAAGQFLASWMGTKLGPRRNVLIGMAVSIAVTVAMGSTLDARVMIVLMVLLGLSQATGWSGNVGTMAGWFHRHERGRVMGAWSTNFNIGSLVSGWAMAWVLGQHAPGEASPWRWCFYAGAIVLSLVWIQFFVLQRDRPEDVGLAPVDDPVTVVDRTAPPFGGAAGRAQVPAVDEAKTPEPPPAGFMGLSRTAWTNLMLVAGFYFFVKFIRYAIWSWAPYFLSQTFHRSDSSANLLASSFDFLGLPGVYATGAISDRLFKSRRAGIATIMMIGSTIAMLLMLVFSAIDVWLFVGLLALVGFMVYGPDALLTGAGAMDIGGRRGATFAAAVISGFGSMGSIVQELVISRVYDAKSGNLTIVFALLLGSAAIATIFCAALVLRNRRGGKGI